MEAAETAGKARRPLFLPGAARLVVAAPRVTTFTLHPYPVSVNRQRRQVAGKALPVLMIHRENEAGETHAVGMVGVN